MAWKLSTTNILCGTKQGIRCAQNMIHTLSLEKFDNNIKSLVKTLKGDRNLLASCGEIEPLILANILRVPKKPPSYKYNNYIRKFQDKYNNGTSIDLGNLMRNIVTKYESLVKDRQWDTISEKYVEIIALTSQIQELKILFAKKSTFQRINRNNNSVNNSSNNSSNNGGRSWKTINPKSGESCMKK